MTRIAFIIALSAFVSTAFAARQLRNVQPEGNPITFHNNCERGIEIAKYGVMSSGVFDCVITPEKTQLLPTGTTVVDNWASFQPYIDDVVFVYNSSGILIPTETYDGINALAKTCEDDPPEYSFVPVGGEMFLCSMTAENNPDQNLPVYQITVENNCPNEVIVGNLYKALDENATYDIRCAEYTNLLPTESVTLGIQNDELTFFSAYDIVLQRNVVVNSTVEPDMYDTRVWLSELIDPTKEHAGCDNQLRGGDMWYEYHGNGDVVSLC